MGYTTTFEGEFTLDKQLTVDHHNYLEAFCNTRRMKRDPKLAAELTDKLRTRVELPIGIEGGYYVGAGGFQGQERDASVVDYNDEPVGQPSLWCHWTPNVAGTAIVWDEGEKFYGYVEWLEYIIEHFLGPWGYVLNGEMTWDGEEHGDVGMISVINNQVRTKRATLTWNDDDKED